MRSAYQVQEQEDWIQVLQVQEKIVHNNQLMFREKKLFNIYRSASVTVARNARVCNSCVYRAFIPGKLPASYRQVNMILFRAFDELSRALFLCKNLTMITQYSNLYLSIDDRDIIDELNRLEASEDGISVSELDEPATVSNATATAVRTTGANRDKLGEWRKWCEIMDGWERRNCPFDGQ